MITLIENIDQAKGIDGFYAVKIRSNILTYGIDSGFLLSWSQMRGEHTSALVQKLDGGIVIAAGDECDYDELAEFIGLIGYESIFTDDKTAAALGLNVTSSGIVMKHRCYTSPVSSGFKPPPFPEYRRLYNLLVESGLKLPDYYSFLGDLSVRVRANTARIFVNDNYSAAALTAFEDEHGAVISAVAVDKCIRRLGLGSAVLNTLCGELINCGKEIYLYREPDKNEQFYANNGFENHGIFTVTERRV